MSLCFLSSPLEEDCAPWPSTMWRKFIMTNAITTWLIFVCTICLFVFPVRLLRMEDSFAMKLKVSYWILSTVCHPQSPELRRAIWNLKQIQADLLTAHRPFFCVYASFVDAIAPYCTIYVLWFPPRKWCLQSKTLKAEVYRLIVNYGVYRRAHSLFFTK